MQTAVVRGVADVIGAIDKALGGTGSIEKIIGKMQKGVQRNFDIIIAAVPIVLGLFKELMDLFKGWGEELKPIFMDVAEGFKPLMETAKTSLQTLKDSLGPTWDALKQLFDSLLPILKLVGGVIGGVVVVALGLLIATFNAVIAALGPVITAVINLVDVFVNVFNAIIAILMGDFDGALQYWNQAAESSIAFFKSLWEGIVNFISTFVDTIIDFFYGLYMTLVGNSIIPDMVNEIVDWFKNMGKWVLDKVKAMVNWVIDKIAEMFPGTSKTMENIKNTMSRIWDGIKKVFETAVSLVKAIMDGDFGKVKKIVGDIMDKVKSKVEDIWERIKKFLAGVSLYKIGKDIIQGLLDGIASLKDTVLKKAQDIADGIKDRIKGALKIKSPSKVMMELGEFTGEGMAVGLEHWVDRIDRISGKMAKAAVPSTAILGGPGVATAGPSVWQETSSPEYVMVSVNLDGREIAQAVTKPSARIQNRTQRRNAAVRGNRL